ncbi:GNAT family N-acetyltransferase [Halobacillus halophilus]|uniref:GNAT family N-acetyltransferase n=1 Tax=Halobacillus halophilus TaxID=1570 RepID=UPI001CD7CC92|nr:GNAT family N-acetyltransferase [Halobacillus halophilus]MCA1010536.1 GNAT family N-acetyltransferase [Halobacillus halophilus]
MIIEFRKDSFKASFGDLSNFGEEEDYLRWIQSKITAFPEGFVLVKEDGHYIGQLELSITAYEGRLIGYVHLFYLIPEKRGLGKGKELDHYAVQFFKKHLVNEYHLRVAPENTSALGFYRKLGMEEIGREVEGRVIRMKRSMPDDRFQ